MTDWQRPSIRCATSRPRLRWALFLSGAALALPAHAQVTTQIHPDVLPGRSTGTLVSSAGHTTTIDGGTLVGGNLFDSFSTFNLATGDTAVWTYSAGNPLAVQNVINRVTGGGASQIDGTLDSTGLPKADFYFINPAGIVFGAGAHVNVPAAAYFSTASELRFADGAIYSAVTPSGSTLTVAPVESFGFLGDEGDIAMSGVGADSAFFTGAGRLSLSAANLRISDSQLQAGAIDLFASGDQATAAPLSLTGSAVPPASGAITISNAQLSTLGSGEFSMGAGPVSLVSSTVETEASGSSAGGALTVNAASLTLDGASVLRTYSSSGQAAGALLADVSGQLTVENGSQLGSYSADAGDAGDVTVSAGSILIDGGTTARATTYISSFATGAGDAGHVALTAQGDFVLSNGGDVSSATAGTGNADNVEITAGELSLSGGAFVSADASGVGTPGSIEVTSADLLIDGAGSDPGFTGIFSNTVNRNNAGDVAVDVSGTTTVQNGGAIAAQTFGAGNSGRLFIEAGSLTLLSGGFVSTTTFGAGNAGDVAITAGSIRIDGSDSAGDSSSITSNSATDSVNSSLVGTGNAGDITLTVGGSLAVTNGGLINSNSDDALGAAGDVVITAGTLLIDGGAAGFATIGSSSFGAGNGGDVSVSTTGAMTVQNGGAIVANTFGSGNAGNVSISAASLDVDGGDDQFAEISSDSTATADQSFVGSGNAGQVNVRVTGALTILNGGFISSESDENLGNAGDVTVSAGSILVDAGTAAFSYISSDTYGSGNGGVVSVTSPGQVIIQNDGLISADTYGAGDAGSVAVHAGSLTIDGGAAENAYISADSVGTGNAGKVTVTVAGDLIIENGGEIDSSVEDNSGVAGDVTVSARNILLNAGIAGDQNSYIESTSNGGAGGNVSVTATGSLTIENGAYIAADTFGPAPAGNVTVRAASLLVDGGAAQDAYISSDSATDQSGDDGTGNAGKVVVAITGGIVLQNDGYISSDTYLVGDGGHVTVSAGGNLVVQDGAYISSDTFGSGNAGDVTVSAANLLVEGGAGQTAYISSDSETDTIDDSVFVGSGNAGEVTVSVAGDIVVRSKGYISSEAGDVHGAAGTVSITASNLLLDGTGGVGKTYISSQTNTDQNGGDVNLDVSGNISVLNGGDVSASTLGSGNAGAISVTAGNLTLDAGAASGADFTYIASSTYGPGRGGAVTVSVRNAVVVEDGGAISAETFGSGPAGDTDIDAGTLVVDGGAAGFALVESGSATNVSGSVGTGNGGHLTLDISGNLTVLDGGSVSTGAFDAQGSAGDLKIEADNILVDGGPTDNRNTQISSGTSGAGHGGSVDIIAAGQLKVIDNAVVGAQTSGTGDGGSIVIQAASVVGDTDGDISSSTNGTGNAGSVTVDAGSISLARGAAIASNANADPGGKSGSVDVTAGSLVLTDGGLLETDSVDPNPAGDIHVSAASIVIDGVGSEISSQNTNAHGGDAGAIQLVTDPMTISNGGAISTNSTAGAAGSISLQFTDDGELILEGATPATIGQITTTSGTSTAGQITIAGPSAMILNGSEIQALGPFKGAFVTIGAGTVIESSDRPNIIAVAGDLVFNSQFEDVEKAVTAPEPAFIDASKVLRGECSARVRSGESSTLVTRAQGPYARNAASGAAASPLATTPANDKVCGPSPGPH